jgi:hypothetical protein
MKRAFIAAAAALWLSTAAASAATDAIRLEVKEQLKPGRRAATFTVYATPRSASALATATVAVQVDADGSIVTPLGGLLHFASSTEDRWLSVRVEDGKESPRVKLNRSGAPPMVVHVVTDAAITANGIVESIAQGFRFPDGSVQTTAAAVSGGVPSVNGVGSAVTIVGAGSTTVGTAGSTVTVTGPGYGSPVAISTTNADGVAPTVARSDHAHAHGNLTGGTLHSTATTGVAGFMSAADKTKLNATVAYARTIIVSPTGVDAVANGTLLVNALNAISGNSSTSPYLLKIEPGIYNTGSNALTMKQYVDIEGSGETATFINATRGAASIGATAAAVTGAINSEIRGLTITNTAAATVGIGYFATGAGTFRLRDVTINSSGGTGQSYGIYSTSSATMYAFHVAITATGGGGTTSSYGLGAAAGTATFISNSTITGRGIGGTGSNYGVQTTSSTASLSIDSSTVLGTGSSNGNFGVDVNQGVAAITNSTVKVETAGSRVAVMTGSSSGASLKVFHSILSCGVAGSASALSASRGGTDATLRIGASQLDGATAGAPTCVHTYDSNFANQVTCPVPIG